VERERLFSVKVYNQNFNSNQFDQAKTQNTTSKLKPVNLNVLVANASDNSPKSFNKDRTEENKWLNEVSESIYSEICEEVIKNEYEPPSVPDCVLDVFKELLYN
jgi:predicted P-loop ATPase